MKIYTKGAMYRLLSEKDIDISVANDFLENFLFDYLNKDEYIDIILFSGRSIDGFSKQNIHKAPKALLKSHAKQRVKRIRDARNILKLFVIEHLSQFKDLPLEQFISQVDLFEDVSLGQKLTLLFLNYNDIFQEKSVLIKENLLADEPPFQDLVTISVSDTIKALYSSEQRYLSKVIKQLLLFEGKVLNKRSKEEKRTLQEILNNEKVPPVKMGQYLKLYVEHYKELADFDKDSLNEFMNLVFVDAISLYEKHRKQLENDLEELDNHLTDELEHTKAEVANLSSENNRLKAELAQLTEDYRLKEQSVVNLTAQRNELQQLYDEQIQTNNVLKSKVTTLEEQLVGAEVKLFELEEIYFVTQVEDASFKFYFSDEQIIYYRSVADLENKLASCDAQSIYFINFDPVTTRDSFAIESCFTKRNLLYRLVSNGTKNIIRTIVYYLEGELRYAIKTEA